MATTYSRWTEDELQADIQRLGKLIIESRQGAGHRSHCAVAYLTQLLRDRRDTLATLRLTKRRALN